MVLVISGIALFGFGFVGELVAGMREEVESLQRTVDRMRAEASHEAAAPGAPSSRELADSHRQRA